MTNTVNQITIPASSSGVVVQTVARAALKTFAQAFVSGLVLTFTPWLMSIADTLSNGGDVTMDDLNVGAKLVIAAAIGAVASLISLAMNFFEKTLPANNVIEAEVKP